VDPVEKRRAKRKHIHKTVDGDKRLYFRERNGGEETKTGCDRKKGRRMVPRQL